MKTILSFLIISFLISCTSSTTKQVQPENKDKKFGQQLIHQGFLKYSDSTQLTKLEKGLLTNFDIYNRANAKIFDIDAEELAEFNFDFFLPEMNKMLEKRNLQLNIQLLPEKNDSYSILINNEEVLLYKKNEMENYSFWDKAPRNFFKKINQLLKQKGRDEVFYLMYGGNDLHAILLTKAQHNTIISYYAKIKREQPYLP
jgi:phosphatidate phosphatase PAH1